MTIQIKRIYEKPLKKDGTRILVDRLWPRGIRKAEAHVDMWAKEYAPSNALRVWFHADRKTRAAEFKKKYRAELVHNKAHIQDTFPRHKVVTLITSVKDVEHSHVPILKKFLENR